MAPAIAEQAAIKPFDVCHGGCPSRTTLRLISDRWTALVVGVLAERPHRFGELRRRISGISKKMVTQTLRALGRDGLGVTLRLEGEERMPATLDWHPWFGRRLAEADSDIELRFEADRMYERDPAGLPTGRLVAPEPGPWDDCFVGVHSAPRLT